MKLTIITATWNSVRTIEKCQASLDRVIPSEGCSIEKLVIDGGSTDGTLEVLRSKFPDVRILSQNGKGLYNALNEGIQNASGEYVMFVHSDDEVGKVDLRRIKLDPKGVTYGIVEFIDRNGNVLYRRRPAPFIKNCLSQYPFIFHPNAIYPRWVLLKYPFDQDKYGLAADMWQIHALRHEIEFSPSRAILYRFRIHPDSSTVKARHATPMIFWVWRLYSFMFFEDNRMLRILNFFSGKRAWSPSAAT